MRLVLLFLIIFSTCSFAKQKKEFMEYGLDKKTNRFDHKKTNFQVKVGSNYFLYDNGHTFSGVKKEFSGAEEKMTGGDLTFGYQIALSGGFSLTVNVNYFNYDKQDLKVDRATVPGTNIDEKLYAVDRDYTIQGSGLGGSINYEFIPHKHWMIQPFAEMSFGIGKSSMRLEYESFLTGVTETYKANQRDTFKFLSTGLGVNIINSSGIFSFLKGSLYSFKGIKRTINGSQGAGGASTAFTSSSSVAGFTKLVYSMGMGYTF